jgi:hypothetical protein
MKLKMINPLMSIAAFGRQLNSSNRKPLLITCRSSHAYDGFSRGALGSPNSQTGPVSAMPFVFLSAF